MVLCLYSRKPDLYTSYTGYSNSSRGGQQQEARARHTGRADRDRQKARERNSKTLSASSRPYDAWEATLTTKHKQQQPATIRIQRMPDAATLRR